MPTKLNLTQTRNLLNQFEFSRLFVESLGWSRPASARAEEIAVNGQTFHVNHIAELSGIAAIQVEANDGKIPDSTTRASVQAEIRKRFHENVLIFLDAAKTLSVWYWVKREGSKRYPRDHYYAKGQPGDLFLSKIAAMSVDISELDEEGKLPLIEAAKRVSEALDVETVTKKFYNEFKDERLSFVEHISGIADARDRLWYASVLLNRLMFVYFLQRKGFIDGGDLNYLQRKLQESRERGTERFYSEFLTALFFEGFAKPPEKRTAAASALIGTVKYLNGGLFLPHQIEESYAGKIDVADNAFENLFDLFAKYSWNLNDTPGADDNEISPAVLGYIFEKYINQKEFGAYYTRPEITEYLCQQTIHRLILDKINPPAGVETAGVRRFDDIRDLLINLNAPLCRTLLFDVLPSLSILDPASGSGAFLVAAMKTLIDVYSGIIGRIPFLHDKGLRDWEEEVKRDHPSIAYFIKKKIITENLFGVDIMAEGAEIARLRLFLALVSSAQTVDQLEPLPNIDFNILHGNSLIGLLKIDPAAVNLFGSYAEEVAKRNVLVESYRHASDHGYADKLADKRGAIEDLRKKAYKTLNDLLLEQFKGIKYEQATWDDTKNSEGKPIKRDVTLGEVEMLDPFHWGYEFDEIMNKRGGFDAIITNPPWEVFQTNEKEFFQEFVPTIQRKKLRIEDWKDQLVDLLKDELLRQLWLQYSSRFPHVSAYFKKANQFSNQTSFVNQKTVGNKPNLYSLFAEQCFNLLRKGGQCGIVIPSGIYTDLGAKQLRQMLLSETQITGLFGFENGKPGGGAIFENVHRSFKFVVLSFGKGGKTEQFQAAFMRHDAAELEQFPEKGGLPITVELIERLSPDSLSVPEFVNTIDLSIAEKISQFPHLSAKELGWGLELYGEELNMTRSMKHFQTIPNDFPLYEGSMIWHFDGAYSQARYWVQEDIIRGDFLSKRCKRIGVQNGSISDLRNDYEAFRIAIRKIASNTNERTLISTIIPRNALTGNSLSINFPFHNSASNYNDLQIPERDTFILVAILNSFVTDFVLRARMTTNLNLFFLYQLPVPRLTSADPQFEPIVERAAKLICTTPEFDDLAKEVGLRGHEDGVTDPVERAKLRAELDGMVAHLYNLTDDEFAHILTTFPLVEQSVKDAAMAEFKRQAPKAPDSEIAALIAKGESRELEFKSSARWDMVENKQSKVMEKVIVKTVAAFLNSADGGTLLIGVADDGTVLGLAHDYQTFGKKPNQDGFDLWLHDTLLSAYGKESAGSFKVSFHEHGGKDICRVIVHPSPNAVWVKDEGVEKFYVRIGASSKELTGKEAMAYAQTKWKLTTLHSSSNDDF